MALFFRLVTLQLEEDPHQRGRQTGADGPAPRPPGRRTRAPEKAPAAHPGDAWGTTATTTGHRPLRDLYGMHAIQAIGLSGAAHAPGHHQHKTRRGDLSNELRPRSCGPRHRCRCALPAKFIVAPCLARNFECGAESGTNPTSGHTRPRTTWPSPSATPAPRTSPPARAKSNERHQ